MTDIIIVFYSWAILAVVSKDVANHPKKYKNKFNKYLNLIYKNNINIIIK